LPGIVAAISSHLHVSALNLIGQRTEVAVSRIWKNRCATLCRNIAVAGPDATRFHPAKI
jgi:hypothetical protein